MKRKKRPRRPLLYRRPLNIIICHSRGSILALTLWSLCLLSTFAVNLAFGVREKIIMVNQLDTRTRLHHVAAAGVKQAVLLLRAKDASPDCDGFNEGWAANSGMFREVPVGEGSFSVSYQSRHMESSFLQTRYGVVDEERKLNVNIVERGVLENLLKRVSGISEMQAQYLSACIADWRDKDSELSLPLGSAEDQYYRGLRHPYEAKDNAFEVLEELLLVKGMDQEIFERVQDYITIYGDGKVNINTASYKVLLSLGLYQSVVDKILFYRCGEDSLEASGDDKVFSSPAAILSELTALVALSEGEAANLTNLISSGRIGTKSSNFLIQSRGMLNNRQNSLKIVCVFERPTHQVDFHTGLLDTKGRIRYWKEK